MREKKNGIFKGLKQLLVDWRAVPIEDIHELETVGVKLEHVLKNARSKP